MIVGIFGTWDYSFFAKAENVFRRNLENNPFYPFEPDEVEPHLLLFTKQSANYIFYLFYIVITIVVSVMLNEFIGGWSIEFVIIPLLFCLWFLKQAFWFWDPRTYVLDTNEKMYEFYRGDKLIYRGHFHNVYIRLKGQCTGGGSGSTYYSVVLDGYHLDEQAITTTTTKMKQLAKLGRKLAAKLNLNYFDAQDRSQFHAIRHRCQYIKRRRRTRRKTYKFRSNP